MNPTTVRILNQAGAALPYSHLNDDEAGKLNLVPNEWSSVQPLLH